MPNLSKCCKTPVKPDHGEPDFPGSEIGTWWMVCASATGGCGKPCDLFVDPKCPRCKGNGRIEMLEHCPECKGSGELKPYPDHFCANNDGEQNCECFAEGVDFGKSMQQGDQSMHSESKPWDWEANVRKLLSVRFKEIGVGATEDLLWQIRTLAKHEREEGFREGQIKGETESWETGDKAYQLGESALLTKAIEKVEQELEKYSTMAETRTLVKAIEAIKSLRNE